MRRYTHWLKSSRVFERVGKEKELVRGEGERERLDFEKEESREVKVEI